MVHCLSYYFPSKGVCGLGGCVTCDLHQGYQTSHRIELKLSKVESRDPFIYAFHFGCEMISFRETVFETFSNRHTNVETYFVTGNFTHTEHDFC